MHFFAQLGASSRRSRSCNSCQARSVSRSKARASAERDGEVLAKKQGDDGGDTANMFFLLIGFSFAGKYARSLYLTKPFFLFCIVIYKY